MIVKMKTVSILIVDHDIETSLEKLRSLGVIHLERKEVSSEALSFHLERKAKLESAAMLIKSYAPKNKKDWAASGDIPPDTAGFILGLSERRKAANEQITANNKEISRIEEWGNFDPASFSEVSAACGTLYPYELSQKNYQKLDASKQLIVIKKTKATVYCLSVGEQIEGESVFALPSRSLDAIKAENESLKKEIASIEDALSGQTHLLNKIEKELVEEEGRIEFETAKTGRNFADAEGAVSGREVKISFIHGYVPEPALGALKSGAAEAGWALYVDDPKAGERPPTLTKNNAFVRIIKPLFGFLGTVPGYKEYDISPSFLIFFCIFFAMIFGDAAYGAIIFIIVALAGFSIKAKTGKLPDAIKLFGLLSLCTIAWGAINGSWFAIPVGALPACLQALIIPQFRDAGPLFLDFFKKFLGLEAGYEPSNVSQWNVQFLCFAIAIVQLVYSHIKNIKRLIASPTPAVAVAQAGWLTMMVGLYFLVLFMLLHIELPGFAVYCIGGGLIAYFIFANQTGGNVFKNVLMSFANFLPTFLNAVSSFADIISYIRLFAVGLAGSAIAGSFNAMSGLGDALSGGFSAGELALKIFAAALILVFGHGLNMLMNALSVIVHGVRLNLLEYAGNHLGMEWSGYSYKPFALKKAEG